jgi:predicted membrane protein
MTTGEDNNAQGENHRTRGRNGSIGPYIPIILVATLVFVVVERDRSDASDRQVVTGESTFSDKAFLSGVKRQYSSSVFRRGEVEAFMGGVELDFRDAVIEGDEARLDVTAVMGGVEIRVPRTWNVINRVEPVLGGVEDHTNSTNGNKRLVIEGTVFMGGLEIKN